MPLNQDILTFCQNHLGQQVDADGTNPGECWDLAEKTLIEHQGRRSRDLTPSFGPDANYVWGTAVTRANSAAGDIVQLRNYSVAMRITHVETGAWRTKAMSAPHHTFIVKAKHPNGVIAAYEQNANNVKRVTEGFYFFETIDLTFRYSTSVSLFRTLLELYTPQSFRNDINDGDTIQITVTPASNTQSWFYHPIPIPPQTN